MSSVFAELRNRVSANETPRPVESLTRGNQYEVTNFTKKKSLYAQKGTEMYPINLAFLATFRDRQIRFYGGRDILRTMVKDLNFTFTWTLRSRQEMSDGTYLRSFQLLLNEQLSWRNTWSCEKRRPTSLYGWMNLDISEEVHETQDMAGSWRSQLPR